MSIPCKKIPPHKKSCCRPGPPTVFLTNRTLLQILCNIYYRTGSFPKVITNVLKCVFNFLYTIKPSVYLNDEVYFVTEFMFIAWDKCLQQTRLHIGALVHAWILFPTFRCVFSEFLCWLLLLTSLASVTRYKSLAICLFVPPSSQ